MRLTQRYGKWSHSRSQQKPIEVDELYDAGSTVGLGQMMKGTDGKAVRLKHEARKLLKKLMEGTTIGSFDELNQIAEHAYYRNAPANENSKFSIENPHLVAVWLIHIEELAQHFHGKASSKEDDDSVSGLMRFFIAHFQAVVNKLLPEGTPEEINKLIETDEYFNKLNFDELAVAEVNILLVLSRLYKQHVQRQDEQGHPQRFSKLLGLHSPAWEPDAWKAYVGDFNACSEKVQHALTKVKTRMDASKLSKDKTRLLQFVPTVDLLEKVIRYLLPNSLDNPQISALTPEEIVSHLAAANIDNILKDFKPHTVSGNVTRHAVEAGKHLAEFYAKQYKMHEDIHAHLDAHRVERKDFCYLRHPRPIIVFGLLAEGDVALPGRLVERYHTIVDGGFQWSEFAMDPVVSKAAVKQARYEIAALAIAGLVHASGVEVKACVFDSNDATKQQRLAILVMLDPSVNLVEFSACVPEGVSNINSSWSAVVAEPLARLLHRAASEDVPLSDFEACTDLFDQGTESSQRAVQQVLGLDPDGVDVGGAKKKRRIGEDVQLNAENMNQYAGKVAAIVKSAMLSLRAELPSHEFQRKVGAGAVDTADQQNSVIFTFKLMEAFGIGRIGGRGGTLALLRPTAPLDVDREALRFSTLFGIDHAKVEQA